MPETINLAPEIKRKLPAELVNFLRLASEAAAARQQNLYLVGGVVRDLLLQRATFDIDLMVEGGSAIELMPQLPQIAEARISTHPRFGTAKVRWHQWSIDLATARSETYARPGALPTVTPGSISDDLRRRDFTVNAMAVHLNPGRFGELVDRHEGKSDLEHKLIRILHDRSFIDDATRIWRALRYEQRLDFHLEDNTRQLLVRDIAMLDTISGDRIRYELECVLQEERPEKVLRRADELKVLGKLHPSLQGNGWLADKFEAARQVATHPPMALYLALLAYPLTEPEAESLISSLKLSRPLAQTLRDTITLKTKLELLANPKLKPSGIYRLLHGYSPQATLAVSLATDSAEARQHIQLFLSKLRYVKPTLKGDDLIRMGIEPGPRIKEILEQLQDARLDGKVSNRKEEEEKMVKRAIR